MRKGSNRNLTRWMRNRSQLNIRVSDYSAIFQ
jgi:hypothetical protein